MAALITQGYIEDSILASDSMDKNPDYKSMKNQLLAFKLFACSTADKNASYQNHTWMIAGEKEESLAGQLFSLTGAGYTFLYDLKVRKNERLFALLLAVFSASLAAFFTQFFT